MRFVMRLSVVAVLLIGGASVRAQDVGFTNAWPGLDAHGRDAVMKFADDFKAFLGKAKSEMAFVREAARVAEASGFRKWESKPAPGAVKPGSRCIRRPSVWRAASTWPAKACAITSER